ncbi:hypothetical protein ACVBEJ_11940 [Porticoccus sp. GXU_MW_L64]
MNTPEKAKFWKNFILERCEYPAIDRLRKQFESAEFYDFCNCGCNSFAVSVDSKTNIEPIAYTDSYGAVFEANFHLSESGKTLEIVLMANEAGNLAYVEIDCCANSYPVPESVDVKGRPYHVHASEKLAL